MTLFINRIVWRIVWHIIFSTISGVVLATLFQGLNGWIAAISLAMGACVAYLLRPDWMDTPAPKNHDWDWIDALVIGFILLLGLRHFAYIYFSVDNAVQTLLKNNYGDLPLHITYIRNMVDGIHFPPNNPYFSLEKLRYPFGMDLYNAFWEQLGVATQAHLCAVGLVMLAAAVAALYRFGGILVVGAFFLNGGWAGWLIFKKGALLDYQEALTWKNFFVTLFITQRGLLMALPLGLWLIRQIRDRFYVSTNAIPWTRAQCILIGIAWGALPLFHMHTFIIVSLIIAFYTLYGKTRNTNLRELVPVLTWAVPLATPIVLYLTDLFRKGSMVHLQGDWFTPKNLLFFFGVELGPWTIFILSAAIYRLRKADRRERAEWAMAGGAFLLFNAVLLAPWDWDKLKVLIWFYLIIVALSSRAIAPHLTLFRKAALCLVLFFSAVISLMAVSSSLARPTKLYEWKELWNTKGAIIRLPKDAVVAATPTFNHPLSFWGNAIAVGYSGHLWSHGVAYQEPEDRIKQLYTQGDNWADIAEQLHLTHIFWGPMERERFGEPPLVWRTQLPNVSPVSGYELYNIIPRTRPK